MWICSRYQCSILNMEIVCVSETLVSRRRLSSGVLEAVSSSEMSVGIYQITQRSIPEESQLHTCELENLISHLWYPLNVTTRYFNPEDLHWHLRCHENHRSHEWQSALNMSGIVVEMVGIRLRIFEIVKSHWNSKLKL